MSPAKQHGDQRYDDGNLLSWKGKNEKLVSQTLYFALASASSPFHVREERPYFSPGEVNGLALGPRRPPGNRIVVVQTFRPQLYAAAWDYSVAIP